MTRSAEAGWNRGAHLKPALDPRPLPRSFFDRPALHAAPALLNKILVRGSRAGRIVEVEAYEGATDPSSHGHRGMTDRNRTMFGPPGHLYVYFIYGMHHCANVVCGQNGVCSAVLLRALAPLAGEGIMRRARNAASRRRSARPLRSIDLCSGPARLCQAFGLDRRDDGADLVPARDAAAFPVRGRLPVFIADDGTPPPEQPGRSGRIGVSRAPNRPWRFYVADDPNVSRSRGIAIGNRPGTGAG